MNGTLILTREQIQRLVQFDDYVVAVEKAFRLHAEGKSLSPGVLDVKAPDGTFHVKAAGLQWDDTIYVAVKVNGNYPQNKARFGLPTIQGAIILCDGINGYPVAILDSTEITAQRTGAATAVAAAFLARRDSHIATICGCGKQGRIQLIALLSALPLQKVFVFDSNAAAAADFANEMSGRIGISISSSLEEATRQSDAIVTCTTSRQPLLKSRDVRPGTFVAAVGADSHEKHELEPELLSSNTVVTDVLQQCMVMGDLHHAIRSGVMNAGDVHAELGEIVAGRKSGRTSDEEITIFDSTGTAIQDVAAAAAIYQRARENGTGTLCNLIG
jgi:alanine dehydrogenase